MRVQRTRSSPSALRSPLTRHPLGVRGYRLSVVIVGVILCFACVAMASRESARVKVTDLQGTAMVGVEVRTGQIKAASDLDGVATFHNLSPGPHVFNAYFNWYTSCGPVTVDVKDDTTATASLAMRLVPGQGFVDQEGKAVTPTAEDLADQEAENSLPCPEPARDQAVPKTR